MMRPPGPFEDDSIDGPLRPLLWRLRARLVTPPVEQRSNGDMDRMVVAARELAHTAPSPGASARPGVMPGSSTPAFPFDGDELAVRRRRGIPHLGRIAAAVVVVVATASGVAGARDGTVTLNALLGRDSSPTAQTASEPLPDVGETEPDSTGDGAVGDGEGGQNPDTNEPDPAPDASEPAGDPVGQDPIDNAVDDPDDAADDPRDAPDRSDTEKTDTSDTSDQESPSDEPSTEEPSTEEPSTDHEVIAAPAPEDVDGFGGPAPRDCESLEDCLPEGETQPPAGDDVADGGEPSDDAPAEDEGSPDASGGSDDADSGDGDGDGGDDLAERRFQPSSDEPSTS